MRQEVGNKAGASNSSVRAALRGIGRVAIWVSSACCWSGASRRGIGGTAEPAAPRRGRACGDRAGKRVLRGSLRPRLPRRPLGAGLGALPRRRGAGRQRPPAQAGGARGRPGRGQRNRRARRRNGGSHRRLRTPRRAHPLSRRPDRPLAGGRGGGAGCALHSRGARPWLGPAPERPQPLAGSDAARDPGAGRRSSCPSTSRAGEAVDLSYLLAPGAAVQPLGGALQFGSRLRRHAARLRGRAARSVLAAVAGRATLRAAPPTRSSIASRWSRARPLVRARDRGGLGVSRRARSSSWRCAPPWSPALLLAAPRRSPPATMSATTSARCCANTRARSTAASSRRRAGLPPEPALHRPGDVLPRRDPGRLAGLQPRSGRQRGPRDRQTGAAVSDGREPIRSYQRIFRPERRIYQFEGRALPVPGRRAAALARLRDARRWSRCWRSARAPPRLRPDRVAAAALAGLPVGGRAAPAVAGVAALAVVWLAGVALGLLDWPLRLVVLPVAVATLATQATPDGRRADRFAVSWLALRLAPRAPLAWSGAAAGRRRPAPRRRALGRA